jgi:hypothetical protein
MAKRNKTQIQFNADLKKFSKLIDVKIETVAKKVALEIFKGVIKRTPVDTGTLRANWAIGRVTAESPGHTIKGTRLSRQAASTLAFATIGNLAGLEPYERILIVNNLPYAEVVEFGKFRGSGKKISGGYSKQSPKGMVRITMNEMKQRLKAVIDSVK